MGVDIRDIVKPTKLSLAQLTDQTIAIDAYNALYQFLAIIRGPDGQPLKDRNDLITSHLSGLFYRNVNFLAMGIKPVYILDGKPPALKALEVERRRKARQESYIRYLDALSRGRKEEARKYAQFTSVIHDYMIEDTKRILKLLGIPWISAPSEGEATAAYLTIVNRVSVAASQDYDSLLFGARRLVRNLTVSGRRKLPGRNIYIEVEPEEVLLDNVLSTLGITREQLIDVGILVGTDFNPDGFTRIGPATALKHIKGYGSLEKIPVIQDELKLVDYAAIREIFLKPKVASVGELAWSMPDYDGLVTFLCRERDFSEERIANALERLRETEEKRSQSLERWF